MPIFLNSSSKIICQGVSAEEHLFELHQSIAYGTKILAFVQAGRGGSSIINLPVFNTVQEAVVQTKADISLVYTEGEKACGDIVEAIYSNISLIISLARSMPLHDVVEILEILRHRPKSCFLGPKVFGIITPGQSKIGSLPGFVFSQGPVGFISSADSLACAIAMHCTREGIGQSTFVGLFGTDFCGMSVMQIVEQFYADALTEVIAYIADISKGDLNKTIDFQEQFGKKPMVLYAPGSGLAAFTSPRLTIVSDMTQVLPAMQKYLRSRPQNIPMIMRNEMI
jgi:succinyl-CoA synthetase alpha subunit